MCCLAYMIVAEQEHKELIIFVCLTCQYGLLVTKLTFDYLCICT